MKRVILFLMIIALCLPLGVAYAEPSQEARAYVLMEASTGKVIDQFNQEEQLGVASLTKLMSYLLMFEALESGTSSLTDMVQVSQNAAKKGGTRVFLDGGSKYTFETLLKPAIMCSANDATVALAEHIAGSEEAFTTRMNERAQELGLSAKFADSTGQSADSHMSATDAAKIAVLLSKYPAFFKYSSIWLEEFTHESGRKTEMANNNRLIKTAGYDGMITGSTQSSGYSVAASLKNGSARYICIVIGSPKTDARFALAKRLIGDASAAYSVKHIVKKGAKVKDVDVPDGNQISLYASEDLSLLLNKGEENSLQKNIELENISMPISAGSVLGRLTVTTPGGESYHINLVANEDMNQMSYASCLRMLVADWLHTSQTLS